MLQYIHVHTWHTWSFTCSTQHTARMCVYTTWLGLARHSCVPVCFRASGCFFVGPYNLQHAWWSLGINNFICKSSFILVICCRLSRLSLVTPFLLLRNLGGPLPFLDHLTSVLFSFDPQCPFYCSFHDRGVNKSYGGVGFQIMASSYFFLSWFFFEGCFHRFNLLQISTHSIQLLLDRVIQWVFPFCFQINKKQSIDGKPQRHLQPCSFHRGQSCESGWYR